MSRFRLILLILQHIVSLLKPDLIFKTELMKIGIIGAGNMGGAIARGLAAASSASSPLHITATSPNNHGELDALKHDFPGVDVSTDNTAAVRGTDIIIVAVKPWLLDEVMNSLKDSIDFGSQIIVSIVAGATLEHLASFAGEKKSTVFELIPNTAISVHESMTFIAHRGASQQQVEMVNALFAKLGGTMVVEERLIPGCMALASCGIAYVMRYIRAAVEGGVELGVKPDDAKRIMLQTMKGAVALLEATGNHPEAEIDKVTTPGGLTIKGLNAMEANGFTHSVIEGLKASVK